MEKLGRFGHHPDPAIDRDIEVQALIGMGYERLTGIAEHPDLEQRITAAMAFRSIETPLELRWLSRQFCGTHEVYTKVPLGYERLAA